MIKSELRYQIIIETSNGREALAFYEMALDSIAFWACYPEPLEKLRNIPNPIWGHGNTPQDAFQDLYCKKNPDILSLDEIPKIHPNSID